MKPHPVICNALCKLALTAPLLLAACGGGSTSPTTPTVTSVTPLVAVANEPKLFSVVGTNLPANATLIPQDGSCTPAVGNTATGFSQQCTFTGAGQKSLVIAVGPGYNFTVNVGPNKYVKICNDGAREGTFSCPANPNLGSAVNEWACTLDTLTSQMWEVKTSDNGLRDYGKLYTSFDDITKNQKLSGFNVIPPTQAELDAATNTVGYTKALNGATGLTALCGSTKWRVPTLPELVTLVKGTTSPTIDGTYFPNTPPGLFATVTPQTTLNFNAGSVPVLVTNSNTISVVGFNDGVSNGFSIRDTPRSLRLVSAPSPKADVSNRIASGAQHTCAIKNDGDVFCWGSGGGGTLGNGSVGSSSTPVKVSITGAVSAITAGDYHTCAIKNSGDVVCWGSGSNGQLGNGASLNSTTPVTVSLTGGATSISAGGDNSCAVKLNGQLVCWGRGGVGGLGNGLSANSNVPVAVTLSGAVTAVSIGSGHACAINTNAQVFCWGYGVNGQLGNGAFTTSNIPVLVSLPNGATAISSGGLFTCAIQTNGQTVCWGENSYGQLGNGTSGGSPGTSIPTSVLVPAGATKVFAGTFHACAIGAAGNTQCWGNGSNGQLGRGSTVSANTPIAVAVPTGAVAALALGAYHSCALKTNASIDCWGAGLYGQLGNSTTLDATLPMSVIGF